MRMDFVLTKPDMCTSYIHNKKFLSLLLHVPAEPRHIQSVYKLIFDTY